MLRSSERYYGGSIRVTCNRIERGFKGGNPEMGRLLLSYLLTLALQLHARLLYIAVSSV